jgi:hypothetical protein
MTTKRPKSSRSQPVPLRSDRYALREYGVTEQELDRFVQRTKKQIARERKAGTMTSSAGDLEADIAD